MQTAKVLTLAPVGLECQEVLVEVAARPGLSSLTIVGLAGRAVEESKERIRLALRSLGITLPSTSIVVNLAPADLNKNGTHYDLPITLALLLAIGEVPVTSWPAARRLAGGDCLVAGELGLDGSLRYVKYAVSFAMAAKTSGRGIILPRASASEATLVRGVKIATASKLEDLVEQLTSNQLRFTTTSVKSATAQVSPASLVSINRSFDSVSSVPPIILDDIIGQTLAKRAATVAIAGGHNLLLTGPPGVGKSLLAQAMAALLPPLTDQEQLAVTSIHSAKGLLNEQQPIVDRRPFRSPHHTASVVAIIGGGNRLHPGEISLAHHGVLFLDELPHYNRSVLEALREPLESGTVTVSRAAGSAQYPAEITLVAAFNPCPCGFWGSRYHSCRCTILQRQQYLAKLSGPIIDRCSLFARLREVKSAAQQRAMFSPRSAGGFSGEHQIVKRQIITARRRQLKRQNKLNSRLTTTVTKQLLAVSKLQDSAGQYLTKLRLSWRGLFNAVRVAQTIADLEEKPLNRQHLAEAISLLPPSNLTTGE